MHRRSVLRRAAFSLALVFLFCLCAMLPSCGLMRQRSFSRTVDGPFDTAALIRIYADKEDDANAFLDLFESELREWDKLADIYYEYEGLNNLRTLNLAAGVAPVALDPRLLDLLEYGLSAKEATGGRVDLLLGSVLSLWHECRTAGQNDPEHARVPTEAELSEAAKIASAATLVIDRAAGTAFLPIAGSSVDVGAVAKGYATEAICRKLESLGFTDFAANVGGNLRVSGSAAGTSWQFSVRDPNGSKTIGQIERTGKTAIATSGSYQRYYTVDGVRYHHVIDPDTNYPAAFGWVSVSVLCDDAGVADVLSTALFCLDYDAGVSLISGGSSPVSALWINESGETFAVGAFAEGGGK